MAKITVDVPQSAIDEKTKKALDAATRKINNLELKVAKLEREIADHKRLIDAAKKVQEVAKDEFMLHDYDDCAGGW